MRIISGIYRGKKLFSPQDDKIRPTSDQIKETIFNILASKNKLDGKVVLDLFCGSGNLGIEALSRGAKEVIFCDVNAESVKLTTKNLQHVKATSNVFKADYHLSTRKLQGKSFDLIFIDPPYKDREEGEIVSLILKYNLLKDDGIIMIEHDSDNFINKKENRITDVFDLDTRNCGGTSISFLSKIKE